MVKKALSRLTNHVSDEELFFGGSDIETATNDWFAQSDSEGQLAVDVYQTPTEIVVKAPVAGVAEEKEVTSDGYLARECFWGSFSRIVSLPTEGEPEKAKATFKNGILTIRIPKSKKEHEVTLKVSS
jgi:HSP20 family protein